MDIIFDMETGDPDDLITLLLLLINPNVNLKGITCYKGSTLQIGLIQHVLNLAEKEIPVGGWNTEEPKELSPYYKDVVGIWKSQKAVYTPVEIFKKTISEETRVLTGAPLTNLKIVLEKLPNLKINNMVTQGGYLGGLVKELLPKFNNIKEIRTYNLTSDIDAFTSVNFSNRIESLTYVTKDICHDFMYTPEIHKRLKFGNNPIGQLLNSCLSKYALTGKNKAMHDPLAMLIMLYPEIAVSKQIEMNYRVNEKGHAVFSSTEGFRNRYGVIEYDQKKAWDNFIEICGKSLTKKNSFNKKTL